MTKISILIPIFNEEKVVKSTIERIKEISKKLPKTEIIAINDGSKDKTKEILSNIKDIKIINHPYNLGYGASLKDGLRIAKGEWVIITDSDGTYPIEDMPKLVQYIDDYDMVVGSRTGNIVEIQPMRKPAKWIIGKLANFLSGKNIKDINSGFRIFNKEKAKQFINLYPSGFSFTTTITLAFFTNDYTVKYIPINYYKREGKSTIKPIKDFIGFITLIFRIIIYFKPLKFFVIPAIITTIIGIIVGIYQTIHYQTGIGQFPILSIVVGTQLIFLGILADMISKNRNL